MGTAIKIEPIWRIALLIPIPLSHRNYENIEDYLEWINNKYKSRVLLQFDFASDFNNRKDIDYIAESNTWKMYLDLIKLLELKGLRYTSPMEIGGFACTRTLDNSFAFLPDLTTTKCTVYFDKFHSTDNYDGSYEGKCRKCSVLPLCLSKACLNSLTEDDYCQVRTDILAYLEGMVSNLYETTQ